MKCPNTECGEVGDWAFCPKCGTNMQIAASRIICGRKKMDGSVCQADIGPSMMYCSNCGTEVDNSRFETIHRSCLKCGSSLAQEMQICGKCDFDQETAFEPEVAKTNNSAESNSRSAQENISTKQALQLDVGNSGSLNDNHDCNSDKKITEQTKLKKGESKKERKKRIKKEQAKTKQKQSKAARQDKQRKSRERQGKLSNDNVGHDGNKNEEGNSATSASIKTGKLSGTSTPDEKEHCSDHEQKTHETGDRRTIYGRAKQWTKGHMKDKENVLQPAQNDLFSADLKQLSNYSNTNSTHNTEEVICESDMTDADLSTPGKLKEKLSTETQTEPKAGNHSHEMKNNEQKKEIIPCNSNGRDSQSPKDSTSSSNEKTVRVHFHVLVNQDFSFNQNQHKLILKTQDQFTDWNDQSKVCYLRKQVNDVLEFEYILDIPLDRTFEYKYCVKYDNKKYEWELYIRNHRWGKESNRSLDMEWKSHDEWHQYDGLFVQKPTVIDRVLSWFRADVFPDKAYKSVRYFSSSILANTGRGHTYVHILDQLRVLFVCMKKIYLYDANCWNGSDKEFTKYIGLLILERILADIQTRTRREDRIIAAISCVLFSARTLKIDISATQYVWPTIYEILKMRPKLNTMECDEIVVIERYFSDKQDQICDVFMELAISIAKSTTDPSWLFLMPWIHILSGNCKRFQEASFEGRHDASPPLWWGISEQFNEALKYFKSKSNKWEIPVQKMLFSLEPMFAVDFLLPRTFMAAVTLKSALVIASSEKIPAEVCLANLIYFVKTKLTQYHTPTENDQEVLRYAETLLFLSRENRASPSSEQRKIRCILSHQLVKECSQYRRPKIIKICVHILLTSLALYEKVPEEDDGFIQNMVQDCAQDVITWMDTKQPSCTSYKESCLQIWNSVFVDDTVCSKTIADEWNELISAGIMNILQKSCLGNRYQAREFLQYAFQRLNTYCVCMQDCLTKALFKAIENGDGMKHFSIGDSATCVLRTMLSDQFLKEWYKVNENKENVLHHLLSWPAFLEFMKLFCGTSHPQPALSEGISTALAETKSAISKCASYLLSGEITVGQFDKIVTTRISFSDVADITICDGNDITKAITVRRKEIDAYKSFCHSLDILTRLCQHLGNVDLTPSDDIPVSIRDLNTVRVIDICFPANFREVPSVEAFQPMIKTGQLSVTILDMLSKLVVCFESTTFMHMWEKQCREESNECNTFDEVETKVWRKVKQTWDKLSDDIRSGTIRFSEFEQLFGRYYDTDGNFEILKTEIDRLGVSKQDIESRIEQLRQYKQIEHCVRGAKTILKVSEKYGLSGNFEKITSIAKSFDHNHEMSWFDVSVRKACDILTEMSNEQEQALAVFLECQKLIDWLKETMKSGLKELKVFVDLAFMSVGDDTKHMANIQCFHSAVTGYAPLIFDLQQTCDYNQLLEYCKVVWNEQQSNPNLPKQLEDTLSILEWLKEIQKSLGSVEVTSLMQADAINSAGIYEVGRHALRSNHLHTPQLDVHSAIRLKLPDGKELKDHKSFTFSQLQDVQSRLMLVAGKSGKHHDEKGNDSVDRFTMIFDSITRLANIYLRLSTSGCVLFNDWTATFYCHPRRTLCAVLEFGPDESAQQLMGRLCTGEDVKELIPKLASFLEKCLVEWLHNIKEKRQSSLLLNYFTVDQLVILQKEIVKFGTEDEPSCCIYPLLSAVKLDCSQDDLQEAIMAAKEEIKTANREFDSEEPIANLSENDVFNQKENFISELVDAGHDRCLALQALQHVDPNNIDDGILWCMSNAKADNDTNDSQKTTFERWSESQTDIQSLIATNVLGLTRQRENSSGKGIAKLLMELQELWEQFLASITSNISDFISLEQLAIILKHLAAKDTRQLCRSLRPGLKKNQPNLIMCPCDDVLLTAMSIYLNEAGQSLPQSDEVILCTSDTTKDEVDIFLRRAINDGSNKIHCLVNAECLNYDVSEFAEKCLEQHIQETHHKDLTFRLVVICGLENEYRSTFISSLDKFKRQYLHVNMNDIRDKLFKQLTVEHRPDTGIKPAAFVDMDHYSVRVIKSTRAGVGKTLYKLRREEELTQLNGRGGMVTISVPLQERNADNHYIIERFLEHTLKPDQVSARLFHIDISHEVIHGVDNFLFSLLILGCLTDKTGWVWRKSPMDLYLIETWPLTDSTKQTKNGSNYVHRMFSILPDCLCRSPAESLQSYMHMKTKGKRHNLSDQLFDNQLFVSEVYQRPFQYLYNLESALPIDGFHKDEPDTPLQPVKTPEVCLQVLLRHCGVPDPSWFELHHFVWFLNTQLLDFERSAFTGSAAAKHLPGFSKFVLRFLIQMSKDFATHSLYMSEESPVNQGVEVQSDDYTDAAEAEEIGGRDVNIPDELKPFQFRRTWESSPHPYLFFNSDRSTFTFLGFYIDKATGDLMDTQTKTVLVEKIMDKQLSKALYDNKVPVNENFDDLPRHEKILKLCNVMGIDLPHDPDDSYELTTDNVKKMLAIYMRFRCDIPVIIMGETGCGKTRLIKFMCALQVPPGADVTNMVLMKVHGGTTKADIERSVRQADEKARENANTVGQHMNTVLFFDEANTTEAIGLIKEIMCDKTLSGTKIQISASLKIVAACNPYRKHSDELIKKLEQAGLGYHVDADETTDRLGRVPMRRLVYRVQPLPQSMLPLVWDFGQLNAKVEDLYIRQMVRRYIRQKDLPNNPGLIEVVSAVLTASQAFMRRYNNECSFVSLRDADRVLTVMSWFHQQSLGNRTLFAIMDMMLYEDSSHKQIAGVDDITRSLILALGVCYQSCLRSRSEYRAFIAQYFGPPCRLPDGEEQIRSEIECCQDVFLEKLKLEKNIARNMALKENVFMMVVCIELRIPLFLVGKPGSSKSLAKTIVSDAMQGNTTRVLFRELKQTQMVSFQCSPLSTPDGIVGTFRQCALLQKDKDLNNYVAIVVLDEVGLAEDSPKMPLKTLHPLLEDGCQGDEIPEAYKKVAFIGISNWALDPAKMNRGILVQRDVPDLVELIKSARGICQINEKMDRTIDELIEPMAKAYLELFEKASQEMREFYGLRDFYSLVKMVCGFVEKSNKGPTWHELMHAIKRNFGGLERVDPESCFRKHLEKLIPVQDERESTDPDCSPDGLIRACLFDSNKLNCESRYLLLLTEGYGVLSIIQQIIRAKSHDFRPITIFGSSFRCDQEYTQVCRNINKIKVCMETGKTVVLLNLENLYESLYDALNQYYAYFGGERYVVIGLGTHRVKCLVHKSFRLIVVAEKNTVYKKFPIPLINRLEKHVLTVNTMLSVAQQNVVEELKNWIGLFCSKDNLQYLQPQRRDRGFKAISDVFIGYHDDACSAIVLDVCEKRGSEELEDSYEEVIQHAKMVLLWCATPDSVANLKFGNLCIEEQKVFFDTYFMKQAHGSLTGYLNHMIVQDRPSVPLFAQITTHSKLMASVNQEEISEATEIPIRDILFLQSLSIFDTEQQFSIRVRHHLQSIQRSDKCLMVIQCDSGDINANLVACAQYCVMDELEKMKEDLKSLVHCVFIVQLPRQSIFSGFQCGLWHSVHIDDLYQEEEGMPKIAQMIETSVATLVSDAVFGKQAVKSTAEKENDQIPGDNVPTTIIQGDVQPLTSIPTKTDRVAGKIGDFHGLIINCVHAALAIVKDKEENTSRETDRVSLVLKLLHQNEKEASMPFVRGICFLLAKLLRQKESNSYIPQSAHDWVAKEATLNESLHKTGTFRRSCLQTLQNKIAPILAGIIAFLDSNDNLKLLQGDDTEWKTGFWFAFFNNTEALQLQYTELQSLNGRTELPEVTIKTTGYENHIFSAKIPFSWIIIEKIQEILALPNGKDTERESSSEHQVGLTVLYNDPIGQLLNRYTDTVTVNSILQEYVHDFVHTVYCAASEAELQLVCESILYQSSKLTPEVSEDTLLNKLVCVHEAHKILMQRLLYFHEIHKVWQECSSVIIEKLEKEPGHFMFQEEEFTSSGLCLMIESMAPQAEALNDPIDRMVWLNKVHRFRPIVEKLIHFLQKQSGPHGAKGYRCMQRSIFLWNRVLVVKLFLEHVCVSDKENRITIKYCMSLWKLLGDETNLKELKSLKCLEVFLRICNKQARAQYIGAETKCAHCENVLEGSPIVLPCKDIVCKQCDGIMRNVGGNRCLKCRQTFDQDWVSTPDSSIVSQDKLMDYQRRCNSLFMDVVSQLCFADNAAPSKDVVEHLLVYIFFKTKDGKQQCTRDMSVLDTGIDPSPVFRSFLLQLLLKTSEDHVTENLRCYLKLAKEYVVQETNDGTEQLLELNLLVIQCIENKLLQDCNRGDMGDKHEAQCALAALRDAVMYINTNELDVDKMYAVARARMGLSVAAKYIAHIIKNDIEPKLADHEMMRVITTARRLHDKSKLEWTRIYLLKYLCRRYGIDTYHRACKSTVPYMRWLALKNNDDEKVVEVADRYIVCGESYTRIREALTQVVLGESIDHLTNIVEELDDDNDMEILLGLAIHREISSSFLYPTQKRKLTPQLVDIIRAFIEDCEQIENKEMFVNMMTNQLSPERLVIEETEDQHLQGIQCLLVHYMLVMVAMDGDRTLLQPLQTLIQSPESCDEMYLPTMPQDDLETVKEALLNSRQDSMNENPTFYHCPNGHLYVIGNCGRPYAVGVCQVCHADIGGKKNVLLQGNFKNEGADNTVVGHILGTAEIRGPGPNPERMMTPLYCASVRLMLHLAMYTACGTNQESVCSLIKPNISEHDLEKFLWDHIQLDIEDLHRALGRSTDDVLLLMHLVLNNISTTIKNGGIVAEEICQLSSKKGREDWETRFCFSFFKPVFQNLDGFLKEHNQQLAQDNRLGADPLLCLLYETSDSSENTETMQIQDIARVWRYCTPISWQHLKQEVNTMIGTEHGSHQQYKVLQLFIEEEHLLKALRFIPSILKLHRSLLHKYQRKIDKKEASPITVASLKTDDVAGGDTDMLLQDFSNAWDIVRGHLKSHVCYTKFGGFLVQEKYCTQRITPATPVSMLLPTTRDIGFCSYAMLDFLMRKHNQFLDRYCKETNRKSSSMASVSPMEVTAAHLISYDPEHDILPLVLANCQYSFEIGKGTKIEYDFAGLERQLTDRFLLSKSRIDVGSVLQIDQMVYRTELTDSEVFYKLDEKIPQVFLEPAVKLRISEELRSLPDICKTLDNVDIAISFLKSTGGKQGENLHHYMVNILQMSHDCNCSRTAKHVCEFKHCKAVWLLLTLLKAKQMVNLQHHSEAIFETVSREFHEDLPEDMLSELQQYIQTLSVDNLSHLVEVLHQFILLKVAVRENTNDEDFRDSVQFKLGEYLYEYIDSMDNPPVNVRILETLPTEILYKHCLHVWITAYLVLHERQSVLNNL